jgi:hypothetical protein
LAWVGGELHYRNCVNTAGDRVEANPTFDSIAYDREESRLRRGCSRLPF